MSISRFTMPDSSMDDNSSRAICLGDVVEYDSEPMDTIDSNSRICIVLTEDTAICRAVKKTQEGFMLTPLNKSFGEQLINNSESVNLHRVRSFIRSY